jgi:23S rRNA (cytidine2498-2'-O)-methyltransferase
LKAKSTVLISAFNLEDELRRELAFMKIKITENRGRLFLVEDLKRAPLFAQNIWEDPQWLEFKSVGDAIKQLKALGKVWTLHSSKHHRRAELIQRGIQRFTPKPLQFPAEKAFPTLSAWTLWEPNKILASAITSSFFPDGEVEFVEEKEATPSRAYLKLWEFMTVLKIRPKKNEKCLDLGSSPGGWTWALAELGAVVTSVDKAALAPEVSRRSNVKYLKKDAFTLKPDEVGEIDWLFSDIICYPERTLELVTLWLKSGKVKNFVCTIKFKGKADFALLEKFRKIPGSNIIHLSANRHEATWYCLARETKSTT